MIFVDWSVVHRKYCIHSLTGQGGAGAEDNFTFLDRRVSVPPPFTFLQLRRIPTRDSSTKLLLRTAATAQISCGIGLLPHHCDSL
ncbi:hypothetical protein C2S51_014950 [Perilla frutescens var. frutescens]|nr:hypothetical protein C2S51_014950 [Perilla frutescens var. frutescens]